MFANKLVLQVVAILLLVFQTACEDKRGDSTKKILLIQKYPPGTWLLTRTSESEMESIAHGEKRKLEARRLYESELHIDEPDDTGNKTVRIRLKRIRTENKSDGNVRIMDSDEFLKNGAGWKERPSKRLGPSGLLLETTIVGSLGADGTVKYIDGLNEYVEGWPSGPTLTPEEKYKICEITLNTYMPRTGLSSTKYAELLPTTPVGIGDTWLVEEDYPRVSKEMEGITEFKYECKLESIDQKPEGAIAIVKFTGHLKTKLKYNGPDKRRPKVTEGTQKASGYYKFNLERGMLAEQEVTTEDQAHFTGMQPSQSQDCEQGTCAMPEHVSRKIKTKTRLAIEPAPSSGSERP